jgi:hypothetical protein
MIKDAGGMDDKLDSLVAYQQPFKIFGKVVLLLHVMHAP